jgi:hypothetical protein
MTYIYPMALPPAVLSHFIDAGGVTYTLAVGMAVLMWLRLKGMIR